VRRDGGRGAHAERSISVSVAARAFTWRRIGGGMLPAIRSGTSGTARSPATPPAGRSADLLTVYGYPIEVLSIGDRTADQVADAVVGLIQDRMTTAPRDEGETLR
jgi:hypothetical protein